MVEGVPSTCLTSQNQRHNANRLRARKSASVSCCRVFGDASQAALPLGERDIAETRLFFSGLSRMGSQSRAPLANELGGTHEVARQESASFPRFEDGPTAVEYAVMLALIIIVRLAAIQALGTAIGPVPDDCRHDLPLERHRSHRWVRSFWRSICSMER